MTDSLPPVATARGNVKRNRQTNVSIIVVVVVAAAIVVAGALITDVKNDHKFSTTQHMAKQTLQTVDAIRKGQVANIDRNDVILSCELDGFNDIIEAARLAFTGDVNPADYPNKMFCKLPPVPPALKAKAKAK